MITVHFECSGKPFSLLLDLVEVAKSHTGVTLAIAFATVLKTFDVEEKVSFKQLSYGKRHSPVTCVSQILALPATTRPTTTR
jgi:hypothetical protein